MKKLILLISVFLIACEENFLNDGNLKIHTITKYLLDAKEQNQKIIYYKEYDINGFLTNFIYYHDDGLIEHHQLTYHNPFYSVEIVKYFNTKNNVDSVVILQNFYNKSRNIIKSLQISANGDTSKIIEFDYDSLGNILIQREILPTFDTSYIVSFQYIYGAGGKLRKILKTVNNLEKPHTIEEFSYNFSNKVINKIIIYPLQNREIKIAYYYNNNGLITKEVHEIPDFSEKITYRYFYTFY
ncbi:MAG: hypothetical protein N2517_02805 [Ignavibacteria bacterium]|nr:hypothetical protein [Ignavibacteria bacterium]